MNDLNSQPITYSQAKELFTDFFIEELIKILTPALNTFKTEIIEEFTNVANMHFELINQHFDRIEETFDRIDKSLEKHHGAIN